MATASPRVRVLRGFEAADADLGTVRTQGARHLVVDPELVQGAIDDGYRVGYQAGFDAALLDAAAAIDARERQRAADVAAVMERLTAAATSIESEHAEVVAIIEHQTIALAIDIAETLTGHAVATATEPGRAALERALQLAPHGPPVTAYLHPDDCETLGNIAAIDTFVDRGITIVASPDLDRGDCIIDIDATRIDARIQPALDRVREVIES